MLHKGTSHNATGNFSTRPWGQRREVRLLHRKVKTALPARLNEQNEEDSRTRLTLNETDRDARIKERFITKHEIRVV